MSESDLEIGRHLAQCFGSRRHGESALEVGAFYGALCYGLTFLVFTLAPSIWSMICIGIYWQWMVTPVVTCLWGIFWGALFGIVVFFLIMRTVAKTEVALDAAKLGFIQGFILGMVLGTGMAIWRIDASGGPNVLGAWTLYSDQIAGFALVIGSLFAAMGGLIGAVLAKSRLSSAANASAELADRANWIGEMWASYGTDSSTDHDEMNERFQFGITRLMVLTAVIAILIATPNLVHSFFLATRENAQQALERTVSPDQAATVFASYALGVKIAMIAISLFVSPYIIWVVIRGPTVFKRLFKALARWREVRQHLAVAANA